MGSTPSRSFFFRLVFERSKLESFHDVSVTRISDTFSYCFPQTQSAENCRFFSFVFRTQYSRPLEFGSMPSRLFSLRLMLERSKLESLRDVSVTRIGDTLSHGFPQTKTVCCVHTEPIMT